MDAGGHRILNRQAVNGPADYHRFRMCATCPPSTSIHVRGGRAWDAGYGDLTVTPDATFDLCDHESTNRDSQFVMPYAYTFYWLSIALDGSRLYVGGEASWWQEFETAAEAEQAAAAPDCGQLHTWPPWDYGLPIGCLILRNDGNVDVPNRFQAVDAVNRGRSYIWRTRAALAPRNVI